MAQAGYSEGKSMKGTIWAVAAFAVFSLSTASASTVFCYDQTAGPNGVGGNTLQDYINLGSGGCVMNNLVFNNFSYTYLLGTDSFYTSGKTGTGNLQPATSVIVQVDQTNTRFQFNANWVVDHYQTSSLTLAYTASAPASLINNLQSAFTTSSNGTENGGPKGVFCATTGTFTPGTPDPADSNATCSPTNFTNSSVSIAGTNGPITITDRAEMNAEGSTFGSTNNYHLSIIQNQFGQTQSLPEPVTTGLVGAGIGLLACLRRRK
jgi:hypothetical protein